MNQVFQKTPHQDKESVTKAQKLLKHLNQQILSAQERVSHAESLADQLEKRNKATLDSIEQQGDVKKRFITEELDKRRSELENVVKERSQEVSDLDEQIQQLNKEIAQLTKNNSNLEERSRDLSNQIKTSQEKLTELDKQKSEVSGEISQLREEIISLHTELGGLNDSKAKLKEEILILQGEVNNIENKVMDMDADYKAKEEVQQSQLKDLANRLQNAFDKLKETQMEDERIRKSWVATTELLDKREENLRSRELKVDQGEKNIKQYQDFLKL